MSHYPLVITIIVIIFLLLFRISNVVIDGQKFKTQCNKGNITGSSEPISMGFIGHLDCRGRLKTKATIRTTNVTSVPVFWFPPGLLSTWKQEFTFCVNRVSLISPKREFHWGRLWGALINWGSPSLGDLQAFLPNTGSCDSC